MGNFRTIFCVIFLVPLFGGTLFSTEGSVSAGPVTVLRDERQLHTKGSGEYSFIVELSDGTKLEQTGTLLPQSSSTAVVSGGVRAATSDNDEADVVEDIVETLQRVSLRVTGRYSFVDSASGLRHVVEYVADENGYRPRIITETIFETPAPPTTTITTIAPSSPTGTTVLPKVLEEKSTTSAPGTTVPPKVLEEKSTTPFIKEEEQVSPEHFAPVFITDLDERDDNEPNRNSINSSKMEFGTALPEEKDNPTSITAAPSSVKETSVVNPTLSPIEDKTVRPDTIQDRGQQTTVVPSVQPLAPLETIASSLFSAPSHNF